MYPIHSPRRRRDALKHREGDVADAELEWHGEVHEPDHEVHCDEEDHDRPVGGEDLIVVLRRQLALGAACREGELRPHHDRVGEVADEHHEP